MRQVVGRLPICRNLPTKAASSSLPAGTPPPGATDRVYRAATSFPRSGLRYEGKGPSLAWTTAARRRHATTAAAGCVLLCHALSDGKGISHIGDSASWSEELKNLFAGHASSRYRNRLAEFQMTASSPVLEEKVLVKQAHSDNHCVRRSP